MLFKSKTSMFAGLAAGTLLMLGMAPLAALAAYPPDEAAARTEAQTRYLCVLPGVERHVVRCLCSAAGEPEVQDWMRSTSAFPQADPVRLGQGGKTKLTIK